MTKILKPIKCSDRLPEIKTEEYNVAVIYKDSNTLGLEKIFNKVCQYFIDNVKYWYEEVEIELKSEKILPLKDRINLDWSDNKQHDWLKVNYYLLPKYQEVLEAAELEIAKLKAEIKEKDRTIETNFKLMNSVNIKAEERLEKAWNSIPNTYELDKPKNTKIITKALKIASYGENYDEYRKSIRIN